MPVHSRHAPPPMQIRSNEGALFIPTFGQRLALLFPTLTRKGFRRRNVLANVITLTQHKPGEMSTQIRFAVAPVGRDMGEQPVPSPLPPPPQPEKTP